MENSHGERGEFPCELCGKVFERKTSHQRHVKIFHNLTLQVCDICGRKFRWKQSLRIHLKTHTGMLVLYFKLTVEDRCFRSETASMPVLR